VRTDPRSARPVTPGPLPAQARTIDALRRALEAAGIEFTNGGQPVIRLRPLQIGDRVRLAKGTCKWGGEPELRDLVGEVFDLVDDGCSVRRPSVCYSNGRELKGCDRGIFQRA